VASLTDQQRERLKLAIQGAKGDGLQWTASGPLAQLARLVGHRPTDLARWDESTDADGRITVRRLVESGNAFAEWPLNVLEAIEREWGRKADREALTGLVERWTAMSDEGRDEMVYDGVERRSDPPPKSMFTLQQAIGFGTLLAMISGATGYVIKVEQTVTSNTAAILANGQKDDERYRELKAVAEEFQRTKLTYCLNSKADPEKHAPDAGC
jgi:hypothetical protein